MAKDFVAYYLSSLDRAVEKPLGKLLEKVIAKDHKVLFLCRDNDELEFFDKALWMYEQLSFLPHGASGVIKQINTIKELPIYLSCNKDDVVENPNQADILLLSDVEKLKDISANDFKKVILFLSWDMAKQYPSQKLANYIKEMAGNDVSITCWQRDNEGRWSKFDA